MAKNISKIMDTGFNDFVEAIGLGKLPKDSVQIIESRRMFYAGASIMKDQFTHVLPQIEDEEECMEFIESLNTEIENFVAGVQIGER